MDQKNLIEGQKFSSRESEENYRRKVDRNIFCLLKLFSLTQNFLFPIAIHALLGMGKVLGKISQ
jgi:hypothetical protein